MAETKRPMAAPDSLKGRTIIVSGGTGTLGRAICTALGAAGANVVVNDLFAKPIDDLVSSITESGGSAIGIPISATEGPEIVSQTVQHFGSIHGLINATLGPIPWKPFEQSTDDDFRTLLDANVIGPISLMRATWPHFKAQNFGRIVNFTSDSILGLPTASTYTSTKGALFGMNKTLAMEGAQHNIKINCVSPIAYKPTMDRHLQNFSEDVLYAFRSLYTPEGNVPIILALVNEKCDVSGEVFQIAGNAASRSVWGTVKGENEMRTMEECLEKLDGLCKKGTREVFEPEGTADFTEFQAKWALGK